jgi:hypothetical protein
MTDANSDRLTSSAEKPTDASAEQPNNEPGKAQPRRSNEFWLALAGIAATVAVGTTGSWLANVHGQYT